MGKKRRERNKRKRERGGKREKAKEQERLGDFWPGLRILAQLPP